MRGHIRKRGKSWVLVMSEGYVTDPETGLKRQKQKWLTLENCKTKSEAEAAAVKILHERNTGGYIEPTKATYAEWLDKWMDTYVVPPHVRIRSQETYRSIVERHIKPALGHLQLQKILPSTITQYYTKQIAGNGPCRKPLSRATLEVHQTVIHKSLEDALRDNLLQRNPAHRLPLPDSDEEQEEMKVWTPQEARQFLETAKKHSYQAYAMFTLALETGMRKGELLGLRWQDVNLTKAEVQIRQSLLRASPEPLFGLPKKPKNKKGKAERAVQISPHTASALRKHKAEQEMYKRRRCEKYQDMGLVFAKAPEDWERPLDEAGQPLQINNIAERLLDPLIKKAGVTRIRWHDLRHTSATLALLAGVPMKVVSTRLGHAKMEITADRYSHVLPQMQEDAAQRVASILAGA